MSGLLGLVVAAVQKLVAEVMHIVVKVTRDRGTMQLLQLLKLSHKLGPPYAISNMHTSHPESNTSIFPQTVNTVQDNTEYTVSHYRDGYIH